MLNRNCLLVLLMTGVLAVWPIIPSDTDAQLPAEETAPAELIEQQEILLDLVHSINQLEQQLKETQKELRRPQNEGRKGELTQRIQRLSSKLTDLKKNLTEVASGVDLGVFSKSEATEINWKKHAFDLLRPILGELTRLTARPREVEQLRSQIVDYSNQHHVIDKGISHMAQLIPHIKDPPLAARLQQLRKEWQSWGEEIQTQLRIVDQQLRQKLDDEPSIAESARNLLELFFRSRGRNFILACAGFVIFWLVFHRLHRWVQTAGWFQQNRRNFSLRLFNVVYTALTISGAVFIFLLVLYLFKDWVLLTLALLFLLGIAWTSKQTLPRFLREVTLLLNLGAVREGERVVYHGIPWLVRSLNFYTRLLNPELEGGDIRLPLRDFHDLRSRSFESNEPWFPTRSNDWVLLGDQTLGKVVLQTPEIVRLVLLGGSRKTFNTSDFLTQSPQVLSTGFRLLVTFGIDYQHQAIITHEIPALIQSALHETLEGEGYTTHLANLTVEFAEAGASSLDLQVLADFTGTGAPQYFVLRRAIQRICVDACNANGWVIPFTQLTLHVASPNGKPSVPMLMDTADNAL